MKGTIARSGSSRPWVQWNSILVKVASSVLAVATVLPGRSVILARVTSHDERPDLERQVTLWPDGQLRRHAGRRGRRQAERQARQARRLPADYEPTTIPAGSPETGWPGSALSAAAALVLQGRRIVAVEEGRDR